MKKITVKEIYDYIDSFAPFSNQCEWDNSGLLVGNFADEVKKIGCALDITANTIKKAKNAGVNLIVSHHPVIFKPVSSLSSRDPAFLLAKYGINAICAHTSLDDAQGGVNDTLADILNIGEAKAFDTEREERIMRYIVPAEPIPCKELAKLVSSRLASAVKFNNTNKMITKIAVCSGAGGGFLEFAAENGCDAIITGEAKHHETLAADDMGIAFITAGHFETENPIIPVLTKKLSDNFDIEVIAIEENRFEIITDNG